MLIYAFLLFTVANTNRSKHKKVSKSTVKRKRFQYDEENFAKALNAVEKIILSIRKSAQKYGIPYETLRDRIKNRCKSHGKTTVLTNTEEREFCDWIFHLSDCGFPLTKHQLLDSVQLYLNAEGRQVEKFTNNRPGKDWYVRFLGRHPDVSIRVTQSLSKSRAALTEESIRHWFAEVIFTNFNIRLQNANWFFVFQIDDDEYL